MIPPEKDRGLNFNFPPWLAPDQVRVITLNEGGSHRDILASIKERRE
jgi:threonyl-tRNA synthetase